MKIKIAFAFSILIVASLACSMLSGARTSGNTGSSTETSQSQQEPSNPTLDSSISNESCQAAKWEVVYVSIMSYAGHDQPNWVGSMTPPNGWNIVFVSYALLNGSDLWGKVTINKTT